MLRNPARERLEQGETALGFGVRTVRSPEIARLAKTAGFDWLFLDIEHSTLSVEAAQHIAVAALDVGIAPLAGIPQAEQDDAVRLLRGGVLGTITPHVETAEEAAAVVRAQLFPPLGEGGTSGAMVHFGFAPLPPPEIFAQSNAAALTVMMLESQRGIDNAEAIAAVRGVDVLLIGTGDLSVDLGIPGQPAHEKMRACYERVVAVARAHGKWAGCSGIQDTAMIGSYVEMGVRFVMAGNDITFMLAAATARAKALRALTPG